MGHGRTQEDVRLCGTDPSDVLTPFRFSSDCTNLMYSPTIGSLEHDRIGIEHHVENENPNRRRNPTDSKAEEGNGECQYKRHGVAYLCGFHSVFGAIEEFTTVRWLRGQRKAVQHGPHAARDDPFDEPDSGPAVEHGFHWMNGLKKAGQVKETRHSGDGKQEVRTPSQSKRVSCDRATQPAQAYQAGNNKNPKSPHLGP